MSEKVIKKDAAQLRKEALESMDSADWTWSHWRAVLVAGTGFLTDSYDNFIISLMVPMIAYVYFPGSGGKLTAVEDGWIKSASSYGNLIGQFGFGICGDVLGRKKVYGLELIILVVGALGSGLSFYIPNQFSILWVLGFWRFLLGIGVGGDYPVSGVIVSEFASSKNRGTMIALVFAMQGIGILLGALVAIISLSAVKQSVLSDVRNLDYAWRAMALFGIVPAMSAVYYRLTIPETPRFSLDVEGNAEKAAEDADRYLKGDTTIRKEVDTGPTNSQKLAKFQTNFIEYFSQWRNLKVLVGTSMCWFLLDIGYYGTNLNTSSVLTAIGYADKSSPYNDVWSLCVGQLIIACCGNVPGYFFTVFFVDKWGRKPIQYMGFTMLTICFAILAIFYHQLTNNHVWLFVLIYSVAQFFFNFGPNQTTFIIPAEVFPTRVRSSAHGISAASGKIGALLASQCFALLADIGGKGNFTNGTLGLFSITCFLGLLFSLLVPETMGMTLEEIEQIGEKDKSIV